MRQYLRPNLRRIKQLPDERGHGVGGGEHGEKGTAETREKEGMRPLDRFFKVEKTNGDDKEIKI